MRLAGTCKKLLSRLLSRPYAAELRHRRPYFRFGLERTTGAGLALIIVSAVIERQGSIWRVNVTKGLLNVKWMMKGLTTLTLAGALALSATPALSWYQGALPDGFIIAQMFDEAAGTMPTSIICNSKLTTTDQLVEAGLRYWNTAKPETRTLRASQLLAEAWLQAWPCSKGRGG